MNKLDNVILKRILLISSLILGVIFLVSCLISYTVYLSFKEPDKNSENVICNVLGENCSYYSKTFEDQFNKEPIALLPASNFKSIYWKSTEENIMPRFISFPYVYTKDEQGVWLRYQFDSAAFKGVDHLQEIIPEGYEYQETEIPSDKFELPNKYYLHHSQWLISLLDKDQEIYRQYFDILTRRSIGVSLHTEYGSTEEFPRRAYENLVNLAESQSSFITIQRNIVLDINSRQHVVGKEHCPPLQDGYTFNWYGKNKLIRFHASPQNTQNMKLTAICGDKYIALITTLHDRKNNALHITYFSKEVPYSTPVSIYGTNSIDSKFLASYTNLKPGYSIEDIAAFILTPVEIKKAEWNKLGKFLVYQTFLYDKSGNLISEYYPDKYQPEALQILTAPPAAP